MSGTDGDTAYLVHTNLTGAYHCLELARRDGAFLVFLSTSRVYPVEPQLALARVEEARPASSSPTTRRFPASRRRVSPRSSR